MHRFAIAAASLIAATGFIGGCEQEPTSQPEPERVEYFTLLALCESGDATPERIQEFLDLRVDVNAKEKYGRRPLHFVAYNENTEVIAILIKAGADVNAKDERGRTPLYYAAQNNEDPEVVTTLIKAGADVNAKDELGITPLHGAAYSNKNPEVITTLIKAGADVNDKTGFGSTPLELAISPPFGSPKPKNADVLRAAGGKLGKDIP